jgi:hypothetical protein
MKTLSILAALVVTAFALYAADGQPPLPQGGQIGRFQLCQGSKPMLSQGQQIQTVFRIDTATGQVWEIAPNALYGADGSIGVVAVWQPIEEPGSEMHRAAMASLQARLNAPAK